MIEFAAPRLVNSLLEVEEPRVKSLTTIALALLVAKGLFVAAPGGAVSAPPPAGAVLPEARLSIHDAIWSLDGKPIKPKKICRISPGEENSVLKQGALLKLKDKESVAGLDLFGGPSESSLRATVYYRVYIEDGVLADIGRLERLEYLNLYQVDLTRGVGLKFLNNLKKLRVLRLTDCNVEVKDILAHLPQCPNLEIVKIWNGKFQWPAESPRFKNRRVIHGMEVARLTTGSPKLRVLFLQSSELYAPAAIEEFARLKKLDHIHIRTVGNMPADTLRVTPRQKAAGERLEKLLEKAGLRRWRHSGQSWSKSFTLPHAMVYAPPAD